MCWLCKPFNTPGIDVVPSTSPCALAALAVNNSMNAVSATPDTLYLIDGSGFIFRAFHALPDLTRADGTHIGAVLGFCNMLHKLLTDLNAEHIAVIFDASRKTFRNDIYPDYKAHRPPPPPELIPQFALIRAATRAFGVCALEVENYEADDVLAAYAKAAVAAKRPIRIVSSDKDLMQLIRPGVEMFDPLKTIPIGAEEVFKKFGVTPDKVADVQALAGDSVDNVPGVPGIGVKTAAELINAYGDLETLLAKASEIKQPKRRELLTHHAEAARISKQLVLLDENTPLPLPIEDLKRRSDYRADLLDFLREQGMRSLLARLGETASAPATTTAVMPAYGTAAVTIAAPVKDGLSEAVRAYELIQDIAQLQRWVALANAAGQVAFDTETTSLDAHSATLVGVSLAVAPGRACYIPVGHIDGVAAAQGSGFAFDAAAVPRQIALSDMVAALQPLLADPGVLKIAHNLKYDMQVLAQHGLAIVNYDDTMLLSYVLEAGLHGHGLDDLALLHFGHKLISYNEVCGTGKSRITFDRVPLDKAANYAAEDADYALRLWLRLKPRIAQQNVTRVYERIERPLIPVVAAMERDGIRVDPAVLRRQSAGFAKKLLVLEEDITRLAGHPFNVGSPKQLGDVLFGELGLPGGAKGKTGAYATGVDVLEPLAEQGFEIVAKVLEWRGMSKLNRPIPTRCRSRSILRHSGCIRHSHWWGRRPGGCPRPIRICRTSLSVPRTAAPSGRLSSPIPAMCCCRSITHRSNYGWRRR